MDNEYITCVADLLNGNGIHIVYPKNSDHAAIINLVRQMDGVIPETVRILMDEGEEPVPFK